LTRSSSSTNLKSPNDAKGSPATACSIGIIALDQGLELELALASLRLRVHLVDGPPPIDARAGHSPIDAIDKVVPDKLQLCRLLAGRGLVEAGSPKH
jgi:hypothetical protein